MLAYLSLFLSALIAATLFPFSSEATLLLLLHQGYDSLGLWGSATAGNTLGACINATIGWFLFFSPMFQNSKYYKKNKKQWEKAELIFKRYGVWTLLFSWLPVIGDGLTFIAGSLRVNIFLFLILVTTGKGARYGFIIWFAT